MLVKAATTLNSVLIESKGKLPLGIPRVRKKAASRPVERPAPKKIEKREREAKGVAQVVQQRPVKGGYTVDITQDVARALERSKFGPAIRAREARGKISTNE